MERITLYGSKAEHKQRKQIIENAGREVEIKPCYQVNIIGIDKRTFADFDEARWIALIMNADLMPVI